MSDNNNNRSSNNQEHEWEHSDFSWDAMKPDIFQKIEEEDPTFFKKDKRRIVAFWILGFAALGLLIYGGLASTFSLDEINFDNPIAELNSKKEQLNSSPKEPKSISKNKLPVDANDDNQHAALSKINKTNYKTSSSNKNKALVGVDEHDKTDFDDSNNLNVNAQSESRQLNLSVVNEVALNVTTTRDDELYNNKNTIELVEAVPEIKMNALALQALPPQLLTNELNSLSPRGEIVPGSSFGEKERVKANWRIAVTGGGLFSFSKYRGNSPAVAFRNDHTSPWFGWQYGLRIERNITKKIKVFAGLDRSVAFQNIDIKTERGVDVEHENILLNVTHFVVGARTEYEHGDTIVNGIEHNRLVNYNELKSLQLNLGVSSVFQINKRWSINPYAGFSTNFISRQSGVTVLADGATEAYDNDNPILKRVQYKLLTGLNLEYELSSKVVISAIYRIDGQLNNGSLEEGMSWKPSHHYIGIGTVYEW